MLSWVALEAPNVVFRCRFFALFTISELIWFQFYLAHGVILCLNFLNTPLVSIFGIEKHSTLKAVAAHFRSVKLAFETLLQESSLFDQLKGAIAAVIFSVIVWVLPLAGDALKFGRVLLSWRFVSIVNQCSVFPRR